MNRFSNYTPSAYSPMSFEEIAMVPMMKRKQHDEMSKNLIDLGVIPVDPLNEHRERALQLKKDLESKLGNLSGELASRGIDGIGKEAFYKLQKERNDLIAPTGEIGIINAATKAMELEKEKFYKNADKQFGQDRLDKAWEQHRAEYAKNLGRDKKGNIINIGSLGSPKYVDLDTGIRDVLSTLGHTTREKLLNSGLSFKNTEYGPVMVNSQGSVVTKTNDEQLNNALNALKTRFIDKTGEGRISRDFEGRTVNEDLNYINNRVLGAKIFEQNKDYKTNYDMISTGNKDGENPEDPNYEGVNVEGVSMTKNSDLLNILEGKNPNIKYANVIGSPLTMGTTGDNEYFGTTVEQKQKILNSQEYLTLARSVQRTQKINVKSLKDPKVQEAVKKYLSENKDVTLQNRYVDANGKISDLLFASKENVKDKNAASNLLMERVRAGAYDMVDEEGNIIDNTNLGKFKLEYNGDMTPKSTVLNKKTKKPLFNNPKQNIGLRRASLINEDGESKTVYISRGSDDFDTPQFKAMETINGISKIADVQPGLYHQIKSPLFTAYGMKNVEIKHNKNKNTYDMSYINSDGAFVDSKDIPDSVFQKNILEDYKKLYNE